METYLKRLELHGFKSFPEKTVMQFHKGITAVVGPNGCGKSNLVDAILWVLGEQRIKNLRGENNEDLIFNGSSSKKPLGMTEVGAFFTNKESETFIARRFFRSGEGKYILNEKFCRNRDVQDTLFALGIGEKNYFIFEQGSIEKIITSKPSERRVLIEEAAGIVQYLERKKDTVSKLVIAQQNLDNLDIILLDKEKRLKELKNQVHFAQRYRTVKNQKTEHLKVFLHSRFLNLKKEFDQFAEGVNEHVGRETTQALDISELEEKLLALEQNRWNLDRSLKANQQHLYDFNNQMLAGSKEIEKLQQRQGFLKQKMEELKALAASGQSETAEFEKRIRAIEEENRRFVEQLHEDEGRSKNLEEEKAAAKGNLASLNVRDARLRESMFALEVDISRNSNEINGMEKNLARLEQEILHKTHLLQELEKEGLESGIEKTGSEIGEVERQLKEKETRVKIGDDEQQKIDSQADAIEKQLGRWNGEVENFRNQREKYLQIKEKMIGEDRPKPGIEYQGLLPNLIRTDKKHHRILENFYYEEMDAPLLVRESDALNGDIRKSLIKREHKAHFAEPIARETGFRDFVKNLYELENHSLKAYFKDGVLVDNLENGIRIFLKYGVDVVTENAEIISRDGILIKNRDRGILEIQEEIKEIDGKIMGLGRTIETEKAALTQIQKLERDVSDRLQREKSDLLALKERLISLRSRLENLEKSQKASRNRIQITLSEKKNLGDEEGKLHERITVLKDGKEKLDGQRKILQTQREDFRKENEQAVQKINEIEKSKMQQDHLLQMIREKLDARGNTLQEIHFLKVKRETQLKSAVQESKQLKGESSDSAEKIERIRKEETEFERQKTEYENRIKAEEDELTKVNAGIKESSAKLAAQRSARDESREAKKELEIRLASVKKDLFQLEEASNQELGMELKDIGADETLLGRDMGEIESELNELSTRLNRMRESDRLNFSAEAEYEILEKDHRFLVTQKEDIIKSIQDMNAAIVKIDNESKESFMKAFTQISENFVKNFKILFEGGEAQLTLSDAENILEAGLEVQAQPPGKRLQSLRLLSGGEKALTSLAFLFALFEYKPSPFCVFDEVDASLDEANVQRFLNFVTKLKEKTQFVIITHNFKTMEKADYVYGISMDEPGISKIFSMKLS